MLKRRHRVIYQFFARRKDHFALVFLFTLMVLTGFLPFLSKHLLFRWSTANLITNFTKYAPGYERHKRIHTLKSENMHPFSEFLDVYECRVFFILALILIPLYSLVFALVARISIKHVRMIYRKLLDNVLQKNIMYFHNTSTLMLYELLVKDVHVIQDYLPGSFIGTVEVRVKIIIFTQLFFIVCRHAQHYSAPLLSSCI